MRFTRFFLMILVFSGFFSCSTPSGSESNPEMEVVPPESMIKKPEDPLLDKGIGPVDLLKLESGINQEMVAEGEVLFEEKCMMCHKLNEKFLGPPMSGALARHSPEWIMNLMLNPEEMLHINEKAKKLLKENSNIPMPNQNLTQEEARELLEYIRSL
jgi:cytochrome c